MGSFVFKWEHSAFEVYVTGTFDEWKKTEKLEKVGGHFEKLVQLPDASQKIYYKFVVDGNWVVNDTAPKEADDNGNENNVLTPETIVKEAHATTALLNSVAPESTTVKMAGETPIETPSGGPGAFPETPAGDLDKQFSVNPLPAAPGAVNPVQLAPGEKVPNELAGGSTTENVKLDAESYEKSDALPAGATPFLSSVGPNSTTAALAATAPIESKVPDAVKESQEKSHVDPEASGVPAEVTEKAAVEEELKEKVTEAPSTSEGTAGKGTDKTEATVSAGEAAASVAAAATAAGAAAFAAAKSTATGAATNLPEPVKEKLPETVQAAIGTSAPVKEEKLETVSPEVPAEVKESIAEAGKAPEAASHSEAVEEKKAMESELLKEVKKTEAIDEQSKTEEKVEEKSVEKGESKPAAAAEKAVEKAEEKVEKAGEKVGSSKTETEPKPATETTSTEAPASTAATNGPETSSAATPEKPVGSASNAGDSPATTDKKKKNRISSFFQKLKPGKGKDKTPSK